MEGLARDSSDEEPTMPNFQLNAVTEALLADLDPTSTAPQDDRCVYRRRQFGSKKDEEGGQLPPVVFGRSKHSLAVDTLGGVGSGGDSVSLCPKFTSMRKPPRRPRNRVDFETDDILLERGEENREEAADIGLCEDGQVGPRLGLPARGYAQSGGSDELQKPIPPLNLDAEARVGCYASPTAAAVKPQPAGPEQPMRKVVIQRRAAAFSSKPAYRLRPTLPLSDANAQTGNHAAAAAATTPVQVEKATTTATAPPARHRKIVVKGIAYRILKRLGRGGSGRVYEVMAPDTRTWAFKAIPLAALDAQAIRQIENEVALLQSAHSVDRVTFLKDWCVDEAKNAIHIIMELGQIDLETIIHDQMEREEKLDPVFIGYYWREMLHCVAAIHSLDIVHSDIKPANFVSIGGVVKIVDFGIAHSLPDDTVHVYLDHLAGTVNYMAPETLKVLSSRPRTDMTLTATADGDGAARSRLVRFGKPSDMWSLGCVLHLMLYGRQPFGHVRGMAPKMLAIADADCAIELESYGCGAVRIPDGLLRTVRACLRRDPTARPTAAGLLAGSADGLLVREETARGTGEMLGETGRVRDVGRVVWRVLAASVPGLEVSGDELERWVVDAMAEYWQ